MINDYFFPTVVTNTDPHVLLKYRTGYSACVAEVSKSVIGDERLDPDIKTRILSHLAGCHGSQRPENDMALQSASRNPASIHFGTTGDFGGKEPRRLIPRDTQESRASQARAGISPYMVQAHRVLPSTGGIPLHYVPVLSTDSATSSAVHHALVPSGPSAGLHLADPLWRPWWSIEVENILIRGLGL